MIGKRGQYTPVGAYLAGDEIIKIAKEHNVNMIHPGWSLLAETRAGGVASAHSNPRLWLPLGERPVCEER